MLDELKFGMFAVAFHTEQSWAIIAENTNHLLILLADALYPDKRMERLAAIARVAEQINDLDNWTVGFDGKPFFYSHAISDKDYFTITRLTH